MTSTLLSGFMLFCLVSSITPGPNNLMLMAAGANFGARRALPHAVGIVLGFTFIDYYNRVGGGSVISNLSPRPYSANSGFGHLSVVFGL